MIKSKLTTAARRDIRKLLLWSEQHFGVDASVRYRKLIIQAIRDLEEDPNRIGSRERPEFLVNGIRTYHLSSSRDRIEGRHVVLPRHWIVYRVSNEPAIEIIRILDDRRDLARHL